MATSRDEHSFVSRGGLKLAHAIESFNLNLTGFRCADLGCSTGGFTDCLLQHGAAHVLAVDTAYGVLEYKLREDARVTVHERSNAIHLTPGDDESLAAFDQACDLVVFDLGWTPQKLAIPAALRWLKPGGRIVSLIKPQYEQSHIDKNDKPVDDDPPWVKKRPRGKGGRKPQPSRVLDDELANQINTRTLEALPELGVSVLGCVQSPIRGGATRGQKRGNIEFLALLERI